MVLLNSSKLSLSSPSSSFSIMVRSTSCCNCTSLSEFATIMRSTRNSSPFEMYPSLSMSYTRNRNLSLSSTDPLEKIDSPATNSLKSMSPPLLVSKMSITRLANGFCPIPGIDRNSSLSMAPELSVSNFMKRLANRSISSDPTGC
ncbi:hypothetical protein OGAPHI_001897 [Ogataea philodendri]|uniref:Uncharacterized protein n=1 Tax=Ogataea philodendri TaxID=1378263 RepID=A0A9P8P9M5_9ASCO|nr:uncharacterized protein OGAPHI_001897 [Ogataea philodendri]KAH3668143.1 hypothetical protein OGAPHI_001897 [Ogataea philodendri]